MGGIKLEERFERTVQGRLYVASFWWGLAVFWHFYVTLRFFTILFCLLSWHLLDDTRPKV
jgi:hypothetical protein